MARNHLPKNKRGNSPFFCFIAISCLSSASSCSRYLRGIVLRRGSLQILEQRAKFVLLAMLMLQLFRSFQPFCFFLRLSVHASTKTSNT
ncbi:hypothetical protein MTR67_031569 [Solanum verrucosum]|uniref:Uncharacterized protein n=1 Tax=Solanum verrucosum TaxID=315347 RepID=A0AAF0U2W0_SOLVR|nr:hypothetical protein MTR67_031569 [Solanum verrucosum]